MTTSSLEPSILTGCRTSRHYLLQAANVVGKCHKKGVVIHLDDLLLRFGEQEEQDTGEVVGVAVGIAQLVRQRVQEQVPPLRMVRHRALEFLNVSLMRTSSKPKP